MDLAERLKVAEERAAAFSNQVAALQRENDALQLLSDPLLKSSEATFSGAPGMNVSEADPVPLIPKPTAALDKAKEAEKTMVSLQAGDLIWLRLHEESQRGTVLGNWSQKSVGVQSDAEGSSDFVPPLRFSDGVFRLCTRFNYRSKVEVSKIRKAMRQSDDHATARRDLEFAEKRVASEEVQNAELLERLVHCAPDQHRETIHYGDVVQLQHVNSGLFVAVHKTPALLNPNCRKVSLKAGSLAAHLRIIPKFKVRSIGSPVYQEDQIVLQSVKHEVLHLGASPTGGIASSSGAADSSEPCAAALPPGNDDLGRKRSINRGNSGGVESMSGGHNSAVSWHNGTDVLKRLKLRMPTVLQQEASGEVNASMQLRSFKINIYRRGDHNKSLFTGLHWFRLFHPEANAFMQASANPDKGQVLDALGTTEDPLEATRRGGLPAHVPYFKGLTSTADSSNPINLSAKAVWCFEPLDRTICVPVGWRTMPLRIRHVPSGKYLSVDSSRPTPVPPVGVEGAGGAMAAGTAAAAAGSGSLLSKASSSMGSSRGEAPLYYDTALVADADLSKSEGVFGSPSSLVFFLSPTDAVTTTTLRESTSAIRIEHHTKDSAGIQTVLHLVALREPKPPMMARADGTVQGGGGAALKQGGGRLCFTSEFSALHVLKVQPLFSTDVSKLNKLLGYIPTFRKYCFAYHAATSPCSGNAPLHMCEAVVSQCVDLIEDLRKGEEVAPLKGRNVPEMIKEANTLKAGDLPARYAGESDVRLQNMAYELKLLDAVFDAALAPYNFARITLPDARKYFTTPPGNQKPRAAQKYLNVVIQRIIDENPASQRYFSSHSARLWFGEACSSETGKGGGNLHRSWELWRNAVMSQGEDTLGAMVTVKMLLTASKAIVSKIVNNDSVLRFMELFRQCGPEERLVNLFTAICTVEKRPLRTNQEMILRKLRMNLNDSFDFGVGLYELPANTKGLPRLRNIDLPDGTPSTWPRKRAPETAPPVYLGRCDSNRFKQVCVAWTGADDWEGKCGSLWFSPKSMAVGSSFEVRQMEGVEKPVHLVPLEQIMWVVEPERLCTPCTGKVWIPFEKKKRKLNRKASRAALMKVVSGGSAPDVSTSERKKQFENQLLLANFVIAQMELLTQLCRGRSYNVITRLEKVFDYGLLMNITTNPHLPYKLAAKTLDLLLALFVDRFPQSRNCGAPSLPEKLWVYHEAPTKGRRRSTTPVIQTMNLSSPTAFPVFSLPPQSSVAGHLDPVLSHPDHFKFFLLRTHCIGVIESFGKAGRMTNTSVDLNELAIAAIRTQQNLLKFGFQSTHEKLQALCAPNGALLDGRSNLQDRDQVFNPPRARYSKSTPVLTQLKTGVIDTFFDVADLSTNFRLGQLLQLFQEKNEKWFSDNANQGFLHLGGLMGEKSSLASDYILQATPEAVEELFADFQAMFPGGSGCGSKLDLSVLASKPDLDQVLIDCLMYEDDKLMSSALRLLDSVYGQRRKLLAALGEVTLLEHVRIPCYGDVHILRSDLLELAYLSRTSTVWGVKSALSGPFGDEDFGTIMHFVDKALKFMHTPYEEYKVLIGARGEDFRYQGSFSETDLQGISYECKELYSVDVALEWETPDSSRRSIDPRCQDILRSCNLQNILLEAFLMDTQIAWKGSICTDREKAESERRLTLVKRALLVCATHFVSGNRKNQEIMAKGLSDLHVLATPPELNEDDSEEPSAKLDSSSLPVEASTDEGSKGSGQAAAASAAASGASITLLAQSLIVELLRGNAMLCETIVTPKLVSLFCHLTNLSDDVSTTPLLDLFFILCKPEEIPNYDMQTMVCNFLTSFETGHLGLEHFFNSVSACLDICAEQAKTLPDLRDEDEKEDAKANPEPVGSAPVTHVAASHDESVRLDNPERLLRFVRTLCEGGNETVATQLKIHCGFTIDSTCDAIGSFLAGSLEQALREGNTGALAPKRMGVKEAELSPQAVLHLMSERDGAGKSLLALLVELVFLLPLNQMQLMSPSLWDFLRTCAVPLMEALGKCTAMTTDQQQSCADLVDILEHSFITVVRLGLFQMVASDLYKERIVAVIAEDVELLLEKKEKTPEFLKQAFIGACDEEQVAALSKNQFVALIAKLTCSDNVASENNPKVFRGALMSSYMRSGSIDLTSNRPGSAKSRPMTAESRPGTASRPASRPGTANRPDTANRPGSARPTTAGAIRSALGLKQAPTSELLSPLELMTSERREELEEAFDDMDLDESGTLDMYEFVQLYTTVGQQCQESSMAAAGHQGGFTPKGGNRLGLRTVEACERFVAIRQGLGSTLGGSRFSRQVISHRKKKTPAAAAADLASSSPKRRPSFRKKKLSLAEKFELFVSAVQGNPLIKEAMQRRTFTMVSLLEAGTPGPPSDYGRSLYLAHAKEHNDEDESSEERTTKHSSVPRKPSMTRNLRRKFSTRGVAPEPKLKPEDSSAVKIQALFRSMKARHEVHRKKVASRAPENTMSGAVALGWDDLTQRMVRYVSDRFYSPGYDTGTCSLIFNTWNAHLLKARTWALDEDGQRLPISDISKASSTYKCIPYELSDFERTAYHSKQAELNRMGVTELLATILASLGRDLSEDALPNKAINLFNELLNGCNVQVQDTLYAHLIKVDTDGNVVAHLENRLSKSFESIVEAVKNGSAGAGEGNSSSSSDDANGGDSEGAGVDVEVCEHAIATSRFLQLLCEGHHKEFQNYLRAQPMVSGSGDVNLINSMCKVLVFLCESTYAVAHFSLCERDLVAQLLSTLIDTMLGPCAGNQDLIAKSDVVAALNVIIHAINLRDVKLTQQDPQHMGLRGLSCLLLAACLEGREDQTTHDLLQRGLEVQMLEEYRDELEDEIRDILFEARSEVRLPYLDEVERVQVMQQFLVAVSTVLNELEKPRIVGREGSGEDQGGSNNPTSGGAVGKANNRRDPMSRENGGEVVDGGGGLGENGERGTGSSHSPSMGFSGRALMRRRQRRRQLLAAKREPLVGFVEISWRGKVERSCFPLPFEINYLSEGTKKEFLDEVDMSTSEKRVKALVKKTDLLVREMEIIHHFAEQYQVYRLLSEHLPTVKLANYGLVVALNFNLLMSPASMGRAPFKMLLLDLNGYVPLDTHERMSLMFTLVLSILATMGYSVIIVTLGITEVPLLIQELDELIREDTEEAEASAADEFEGNDGSSSSGNSGSSSGGGGSGGSKQRTDGRDLPLLADEGGPPVTRDPKAWLPLSMGVTCGSLFVTLHWFNFDANMGLYAGVLLFFTLPCALLGLRMHIGSRPANLRQRSFAIAYDCVIKRSFFRNHVILMCCCLLGVFLSSEYNSLGLLDIILISSVIADIIKSVTSPGTALGLVFYLFCCSVLIFTNFGMSHFHEALQAPTYDYDDESSGRQACRTTLSCFYLVFYHGLNEAGNVKGILLSANPGNTYLFRIIADSIFFVWVGIVLVNIITGLMVDTFSAIREEKQSRADTLENDCFVCGTLRNTYENYALPNSAPSFDGHLTEDHDIWTYVHYIAYLKKKNPTEDSGIESYVRSQLDTVSIDWIPTRTSYVLESEGKTGSRVVGGADNSNLSESPAGLLSQAAIQNRPKTTDQPR